MTYNPNGGAISPAPNKKKKRVRFLCKHSLDRQDCTICIDIPIAPKRKGGGGYRGYMRRNGFVKGQTKVYKVGEKAPPDPKPKKKRGGYDPATYYSTKHWMKRRDLYFKDHDKLCIVCKSDLKVELHHMTYIHIWNEPDDDLIPVCQYHHGQIHKLAKTEGLGVYNATQKFLKNAV